MPYGLNPSFQPQGQEQQPGAGYPRPGRGLGHALVDVWRRALIEHSHI